MATAPCPERFNLSATRRWKSARLPSPVRASCSAMWAFSATCRRNPRLTDSGDEDQHDIQADEADGEVEVQRMKAGRHVPADGGVRQVDLEHADLLGLADARQRQVHLDGGRADRSGVVGVGVEPGEPGHGVAGGGVEGLVLGHVVIPGAVVGVDDLAFEVAQAQPQDPVGRADHLGGEILQADHLGRGEPGGRAAARRGAARPRCWRAAAPPTVPRPRPAGGPRRGNWRRGRRRARRRRRG